VFWTPSQTLQRTALLEPGGAGRELTRRPPHVWRIWRVWRRHRGSSAHKSDSAGPPLSGLPVHSETEIEDDDEHGTVERRAASRTPRPVWPDPAYQTTEARGVLGSSSQTRPRPPAVSVTHREGVGVTVLAESAMGGQRGPRSSVSASATLRVALFFNNHARCEDESRFCGQTQRALARVYSAWNPAPCDDRCFGIGTCLCRGGCVWYRSGPRGLHRGAAHSFCAQRAFPRLLIVTTLAVSPHSTVQ
jgi:hypothetical protein